MRLPISPDYICKGFHGDFLKCNCIIKLQDKVALSKVLLEQKVKDFWSEPTHLNNRFHGVVDPFLGEFLCPYDVSNNEKARYIFSIGNKDFEICLATLTHIFGLGQAAYIAARKVLINKKFLGLKLLKKASQVNLKSSPDLLKDYWLFKKWFNHQVVPVSLQSKRARCLLKVLQGVIVELNDDSISAIDYINANHQPYYEDLSHVTNGGDNIMFGPPGRGLEEWGSFDKKPQLKPFINQVKPAILKCIDMPHIKDFQYSVSFLFFSSQFQ